MSQPKADLSTSVSKSAAEEDLSKIPEKLSHTWTFWYMIRTSKHVQAVNYECNIHPLASFATMHEFLSIYVHLKRPNELPGNSDYHLFRAGVKPVWEDAENAQGGKWIVRLRKGLIARLWEHLIIGLISGQFGADEEICGVVASIRYQEDILSVWNRTAHSATAIHHIRYIASILVGLDYATTYRDRFREILSLPPHTTIEYKAHNQSMKDNSSFRNTDKFKS